MEFHYRPENNDIDKASTSYDLLILTQLLS